ncbi:unnamed protein product [Larinioides sclopetarius]|uniref:Uncharacterized protein n=1 Tax=Larinioides sclopetarius TaxID=280406 RepID=A0AAV2BT02_9ARAC
MKKRYTRKKRSIEQLEQQITAAIGGNCTMALVECWELCQYVQDFKFAGIFSMFLLEEEILYFLVNPM